MDKEVQMQKHIYNIKKSANLYGNNSVKYEYILTAEELYDRMNNQIADLNYPLRKEVKRDRYVVNTKALRDSIVKATAQVLNEYQHEMYVFINNDVNKLIEKNAYDILNQVLSLGSSSNNSRSEDIAYKLGAAFGLAIGNAISDIVINDMFK